jgi:hypothetical protein
MISGISGSIDPDGAIARRLKYKVSIKEHISRVLWNCAALYCFWPDYVESLKLAN